MRTFNTLLFLLILTLESICQTLIPITTGLGNSNATNLTVFDGKLYFTAMTGTSTDVYYIIGNNPPVKVVSTTDYPSPEEFTVLGNRLFFSSGTTNRQAYYILAGTTTINEVPGNYSNPTDFVANNSNIYFQSVGSSNQGIYVWNGIMTSQLTNQIGRTWFEGGTYNFDHEKHLIISDNKIFFHQQNGVYYVDLQNPNGAILVTGSQNYFYDMGASSDNTGIKIGNKLIYSAASTMFGIPSQVLIIDGLTTSISTSTIPILDPDRYISYNGLLFFLAYNNLNEYVLHYYDPVSNQISSPTANNIEITVGSNTDDPLLILDGKLYYGNKEVIIFGNNVTINSNSECFTIGNSGKRGVKFLNNKFYWDGFSTSGFGFEYFSCPSNQSVTCIEGGDNVLRHATIYNNSLYFVDQSTYPSHILKIPEDAGNGLCQSACTNDNIPPVCSGIDFTVQLDLGQDYYTFDINDFASDECATVLTYENANLDPNTPNGTTTHFWSGNGDQFMCGTYFVTSSFPFDTNGNFSDCAFTFTVDCETDTCINVALDFDGIDDYIELNSPFSSDQNYTIELWVKSESISTGTCSNNSSANLDWILAFDDNDLGIVDCADGYRVVFAPLCPSGNNLCSSLPTQNLNDNLWHHLAISEGSVGGFRVYFDGVKFTNFSNDNYDLSGKIRLGSQFGNQAGNKFKGKMDEFRIWNYIRSEEEILANYNCKIDPNTDGLVTYYSFSVGNIGNDNQGLAEVADLAGNDQNGTLHNFSLVGNSSNFVDGIESLCNLCGNATSTLDPDQSYLLIYPVPTSDQLTVWLGHNLNGYAVEIIDISGKRVLSSNFDKSILSHNLDVSHLNSGLYIIKLNNNKEVQLNAKFVKL